MFCSDCGKKVDEAARFCNHCGYQFEATNISNTQNQNGNDKLDSSNQKSIFYEVFCKELQGEPLETGWDKDDLDLFHLKDAHKALEIGGKYDSEIKKYIEVQLNFLAKNLKEKNNISIDFLKNPLSIIQFFNDKCDDDALKSISHIIDLEQLGFGSSVTNFGMRYIRYLKNLKFLNLRFSKVTDEGLRYVDNLVFLENISMSNYITDSGLFTLKKMTRLKNLDLEGCCVSDSGLESILHLENIESISLSGDLITNEGLNLLAKFKKLKKLSLLEANITDSGISIIEKMKSLNEISIGKCKLTYAGLNKLKNCFPDAEIRYDEFLDLTKI